MQPATTSFFEFRLATAGASTLTFAALREPAAMKPLLYIGRHVAAVGVAAALAALVWTIVYVALLLFAIMGTPGNVFRRLGLPHAEVIFKSLG
jgi:hypothetical protein